MDGKESKIFKEYLRKATIFLVCSVAIFTGALGYGCSVASSATPEMKLQLYTGTVDFSTFYADKRLNPYDTPYLTAEKAVKFKVESSVKYDLKVEAKHLEATQDSKVPSTIPITNLYWKWPVQTDWHPFSLSPQIVESGVSQAEKEYEFDYRIFSETHQLGWDTPAGTYETTITYSIFPSDNP